MSMPHPSTAVLVPPTRRAAIWAVLSMPQAIPLMISAPARAAASAKELAAARP